MTRQGAALALELRVQWCYRIPAVALVLTVLWTLALLAVPDSVARGAGPMILTLDTATFGFFFIAALSVSRCAPANTSRSKSPR